MIDVDRRKPRLSVCLEVHGAHGPPQLALERGEIVGSTHQLATLRLVDCRYQGGSCTWRTSNRAEEVPLRDLPAIEPHSWYSRLPRHSTYLLK